MLRAPAPASVRLGCSREAIVLRCEPLGEKKVTRVTEIDLEVKIFMVGGMVEDRIVSDMKDSYAKAAAFTNRYVKEKGY